MLKPPKQPCAVKTIIGYISAAATYLRWRGVTASPYMPGSGGRAMHPAIADILNHRRKWRPQKQRKEPVTAGIFQTGYAEVQRTRKHSYSGHLDLECAIWDWTALGCHTGFRLSEFGQSKKRKKARFATVPHTRAAGEWAGSALALIESDFQFFDHKMRRIPIIHAIFAGAAEMHIRFRYNKNTNTFQTRRFRCIPRHPLCPVTRARCILQRSRALCVPANEPVGVFRTPGKHTYTFIEGKHVSSTLRRWCCLAYPDKNHYMRLHIDMLVTHSYRVTACVALYTAGVKLEEIVYRLRWSSDAVEFYIRECGVTADYYTLSAVQGALAT